jgi:predicted kinase
MGKLFCKIMRGCSGSGKSTYTKTHFPNALVLSTDDFWINKDTGAYEFDIKRHSEAHAWNLRRFVDAVQYWAEDGCDESESPGVTIVVDNTNCSVAEFAPYAAVAGAFGFDVEIITVDVDTDTAHARNQHNVPQPTVHGQRRNLIRNNDFIPKWWKHTFIKQE